MKNSYEKGLAIHSAPSLASDTARWRLKRRQRNRWAGLLSFEKSVDQDADLLT